MPRLAWVAVLAALLAGCGGARHAADGQSTEATSDVAPKRPPVNEQSMPLREPESPIRTVVHGDTLYSIAWEAGRDYRELAAWNRIRPPYTIKPGQELRVTPPAATEASKARSIPAARSKSSARGKNKSATGGASLAAKPVVAVASRPGKGKAAKPVDARKTASGRSAKDSRKASGSASADRLASAAGVGSWMWPADGQVLNRYSESDTKGLDITGARGTPVRAAANGRVVYQGSGLRGYGQLIIVKHNDEFLSAYAHNDRIYVKEGDVVKRGQKIADMGSTGTDRVKLHFEIRRQGAPIDPLKYLPRR